ncbi:DNA polymerase III subunit gamma/tau [Bibersteinia trehalosi]|uniref:DNA polymerase III subunit gamma/tau n=1 Tax=Bibersteinia trehalosi TaxID=47735 RepID=UPI00404614EA
MSYQVLARKWRPQRFSQVVGQQHVLSALENSLRENRLHHAYLFSGTRGVGKTSIARLFAKGLNCEQGISAEPCGECANCKAIEEGRFIDLIEIDAASRTKVEDTRELLDNVQYKPTVGRFKVYLIDEVHMLSRSSFNALLKTLEEPPEYVKFLLATTDPQKLPITILSRCMQFHLRALDQSQIRKHLEFVLGEEQIPFEFPALERLAKAAQGSIRDSLSLTDQAIALSNANITLAIVSQMLGLLDENQPLELVQALALADGEKTMQIVQDVAERGVDWQQLLSDVAETLHQIAMLQLLPNKDGEETPLHFLARSISPEDVQFFYQVMLSGKKELPYAPEPRRGIEMTMLRALAFHPKNADKSPIVATGTVPVTSAAVNSGQQIAQLRDKLVAQQASVTSQAVQNDRNSANSASNMSSTPTVQTAVSGGVSAAMQALQASRQLKAQQQESEKKKSEQAVKISTPNLVKASSAKQAVKNVEQSFARLLSSQDKKRQIDLPRAPTQEQVTSDEEYRWQWLNPELENQQETANPSEIKQAILQERTPELVKKTIELSCQQDAWAKLANELNLGGFSRQLALNSYMAEKRDDYIKLVLKPAMSRLNNDESRKNLADALKAKGLDLELIIGEDDRYKTPLEIRRAIFEELTQAARVSLFADDKLKLLQQAFEAEIDESTIRAVAE